MQPHQGGIRVMLVDRHRIILSGLQRLVDGNRPAMEVVGTATSVSAAAELSAKVLCDVVVLDAAVLRHDRQSDIPSLTNGHGARVLILSDASDTTTHEAAVLRGACGVVRKDDSPEVLFKAIAKVHEGELWLDRCTTGRVFVELSRQKADPEKKKISLLTAREQDVVRTLVSEPGADNRRLAASLRIGEHTLRNHLSRIYDKLGVPNRLELYVFAQRHGVSDLRAR